MPQEKYNTGDDDLYLWRCHPERLCINCRYFKIYPEDEERYFGMQCEHGDNFWGYYTIGSYEDKSNFIRILLTSRKCEGFKLKDNAYKV